MMTKNKKRKVEGRKYGACGAILNPALGGVIGKGMGAISMGRASMVGVVLRRENKDERNKDLSP